MCTDDTKQSYVFLKAFGDKDTAFLKNTLRERMKNISEDLFETEYYARLPISLNRLFSEYAKGKFIKQDSSMTWSITEFGKQLRDNQFNQYVERSLPQTAELHASHS